jgi:hypothetical protein
LKKSIYSLRQHLYNVLFHMNPFPTNLASIRISPVS